MINIQPETFAALPSVVPGITAVLAHSARAFPRHSHDQFGIGVIEFGAQASHSGRGQVQVQAGDLITVNPNEVHDGLPIAAAPRRWRMLYIDPAVIRTATKEQAEFCWPALTSPKQAARLRRLFGAVTGADDTATGLSIDSDLLLLLRGLQDRPRQTPPRAHIDKARHVLTQDPAAVHALTALADLCGTSRFHFLRSFAAAMGLTPHAYQMQQRLHLARRLIAQQTPLAEAATTAGFADQSHMTRLFRRNFGLTPGAYARAHL